MERALTVSWSDPHAAFDAGRKLTSTCLILG
jgi:hypothetical protein